MKTHTPTSHDLIKVYVHFDKADKDFRYVTVDCHFMDMEADPIPVCIRAEEFDIDCDDHAYVKLGRIELANLEDLMDWVRCLETEVEELDAEVGDDGITEVIWRTLAESLPDFYSDRWQRDPTCLTLEVERNDDVDEVDEAAGF